MYKRKAKSLRLEVKHHIMINLLWNFRKGVSIFKEPVDAFFFAYE
jgi:hypothetical protein